VYVCLVPAEPAPALDLRHASFELLVLDEGKVLTAHGEEEIELPTRVLADLREVKETKEIKEIKETKEIQEIKAELARE
jgi:hypothetical protein